MAEKILWFPDQATRLRIYEILGILLLISAAVFVGVLYTIGTAREWTVVDLYPTGGVIQNADQVGLVNGGRHLVWVDPDEDAVCATDLARPGDVFCLQPSPSYRVRPVDVLDGDLIVLRSAPRASPVDILLRGWKGLSRDRAGRDAKSEWVEPPFDTHLERVDLRTGEIRTEAVDESRVGRKGEIPDVDIKMGRVALSPDRLNLAWWRANEENGETPLSAGVNEVFEVFSTGPKLESLYIRRFRTGGGLSIRSRLLMDIGQPRWLSNEVCLLLSLLDSGSFVPFDLERGEVQATMPVSMVHKLMRETVNEELYDPESVHMIRGDGENAVGLFAWARSTTAAYFFVFDAFFRLARFERIGFEAYDFGQPIWLEQSQLLLAREAPEGRLVGLSPRGQAEAHFPVPPDWGEGFNILGETAERQLVGYNRGLFLRAESGSTAWETVQLLR